MSRYDGLIIPRSYSEYINKTDAATLQQALQLSGVLSGAVAAGDNKAVTSNAVNGALANYVKYIDYEGTTDDNGLLDLYTIGNYIPILAKGFPYITNFFNGASKDYNPYVRITNYDGTPYANQSASMRLCVLPLSNM